MAQSIITTKSGLSSPVTYSGNTPAAPITSRPVKITKSRMSERKSIDISDTISQSRDNADLQPLIKDTSTFKSIKDRPNMKRMSNKQKHLSHLEDKRITYHRIRNK